MSISGFLCRRGMKRRFGQVCFRYFFFQYSISSISRQDHASGALLIEEAGGIVSDMNGRPLDFSRGRTLSGNKGVVAAPKNLHTQVLHCVQQALSESEAGKL